MRVTYIGYDYFSPVLLHLAGREDVRIVRVVSTAQPWGSHVRSVAGRLGLPLCLRGPAEGDMRRFAQDSDLVLCASYGARLAIPGGTGCAFLNIHPSLLPLGRGPAPMHWALTDVPQMAGVTIHAMDAGFDTGPIVLQASLGDRLPCSFELFTHLANQAAIRLVATLDQDGLRRLAPVSQAGKPASHYPVMPEGRRTISPDWTGTAIAALVSAMGPLGALVDIEGTRYVATRVEAVAAERDGSHPYVNNFYGYYPCADGYCLFHRANLTPTAP